MTEILTESFCERCGTRYTFETVAPRQGRLGGLRVLGRGLKTFVMSDDTSLDDALASARSDEEREITGHQLDAFHKTFNFCMSCRQYTCANCWNEIEGHCLSCAPRPDSPVGEAPFQFAAAAGTAVEPGPTDWQADDLLRRLGGTEVAATVAGSAGHNGSGSPASIETPQPIEAPSPAEALLAGAATPDAAPDATVEPPEAAPAESEEAAPADRLVEASTDRTAESAARQTLALMGRFRPGQSLDAEIEAYEASLEPKATPTIGEPAAEVAEPEAVPAAEVEAPEVALEVAAPEAPAELETAAAPPEAPFEAPSPPAEPLRRDIVEQPAWPSLPLPGAEPGAAPGAEPQWPTGPRWPTAVPARPLPPPPTAVPPLALGDAPTGAAPAADPLAFLTARRAGDAMWTLSAQDVVRPPVPGVAAPTPAVHSCVNCGLSLSATARFCRRCGTRQTEG